MSRPFTALRLTEIAKWITPAVAFIAIFGVLALVNRSHGPAADAGFGGGTPGIAREPASLDTQGQITELQAAARESPDDAQTYALLGDAYYQRARETGDPTYYSRADGAFGAALHRDPRNATAATGTSQITKDTERVGSSLYRYASLPFEIASILLLVAIIGSVMLARTLKQEVSADDVDPDVLLEEIARDADLAQLEPRSE